MVSMLWIRKFRTRMAAGNVVPVSGFSAEVLSDTEITLTWTDGGSYDRVDVERWVHGTVGLVTTTPIAEGAEVLAITGLLPETSYVFRARGMRGGRASSWSSVLVASTEPTPVGPPVAENVLFTFDPATDVLEDWDATIPLIVTSGNALIEVAGGLLHLVSSPDDLDNRVQAATYQAFGDPTETMALVVSLKTLVSTIAVLPGVSPVGQIALMGIGAQADTPVPTTYDDMLYLYRPYDSELWQLSLTNRDWADYPQSEPFALSPAGTVLELLYDASGPVPVGSLHVDGELVASVLDTSTGEFDPYLVPNMVYLTAGTGQVDRSNFDVEFGLTTVADGLQGV